MKKDATLLTWLFSAPLKFSVISFIMTMFIVFIYSLTASNYTVSSMPLFILLTLAIAWCTYLTIRKLPKIKMDKPSFIAIHNAQTILLFLLFTISTYLLMSNQQSLLFRLMMFDASHSNGFLFIVMFIALFLFFLMGTALINFYVKICRIQQFNIPAWKVIFSWPFGFGMLWIPGYLLNTKLPKKPSQEIKSKIYSKITNWTLANTINTISMFAFMTVLSSFFVGLAPTLLTFVLTLIFGLWSLNIGPKKFETQMPKTYSTIAVIINIAMIIAISCFYLFAPQPNVHINISDTTVITTQGQ